MTSRGAPTHACLRPPSAFGVDISGAPSVVNEDGTTESGSLIDEIVREGARRMLAAALEAEVDQDTVCQQRDLKDRDFIHVWADGVRPKGQAPGRRRWRRPGDCPPNWLGCLRLVRFSQGKWRPCGSST